MHGGRCYCAELCGIGRRYPGNDELGTHDHVGEEEDAKAGRQNNLMQLFPTWFLNVTIVGIFSLFLVFDAGIFWVVTRSSLFDV